MSRSSAHPRLRLWTLVGSLALVVLAFAYFLMLETGAFDSKTFRTREVDYTNVSPLRTWSLPLRRDEAPSLSFWLYGTQKPGPEHENLTPGELLDGIRNRNASPELALMASRELTQGDALWPRWFSDPMILARFTRDFRNLTTSLSRPPNPMGSERMPGIRSTAFRLNARLTAFYPNQVEFMGKILVPTIAEGLGELRIVFWQSLAVESRANGTGLNEIASHVATVPDPGWAICGSRIEEAGGDCLSLVRGFELLKNRPARERVQLATANLAGLEEAWLLMRLCPNRSRTDINRLTDSVLGTFDQPVTGRTLPKRVTPGFWSRWSPAPNASEAAIFSPLWVSIDEITRWRARYFDPLAADRELLRCAVAVARYRRAHGKAWPGSLAELVPDILPSVPVDPYDGKPLRYDATRHLLWSAGSDLRDDGGRLPPPADQPVPGVGSLGSDSTEPTVDLGTLLGL